jgi:glycine betaine catabolism B
VTIPLIKRGEGDAGAVHVLGAADPNLPAPGRYALALVERRPESPSTMTFRFSTEGTGFRYRSNQAVRLALPGVDDPWGAIRTFSLSSSPSEEGIIGITCKISDTPFKQALARLPIGGTAHVYGPLGHFLLDPASPGAFVAGGIGITPFRGMLRYAADRRLTPPMTLFYSARVPEELIFRSELDEIARTRPNIRVEYTITRPAPSALSWAGRTGRVDTAWLQDAVSADPRTRWYVAGLPEMVSSTVALLNGELGVSPDRIEYELFRGY